MFEGHRLWFLLLMTHQIQQNITDILFFSYMLDFFLWICILYGCIDLLMTEQVMHYSGTFFFCSFWLVIVYELCLNITRSCFSLLDKSYSYHLHLSLFAATIQIKRTCKAVDGLYEKGMTFSHTLLQEWTVLLTAPLLSECNGGGH